MHKSGPWSEQPPVPPLTAARAVAASIARTPALLIRRRVRQPRRNVGTLLRFADGTTTRVYRETVMARPAPAEPTVLLVAFRLRGVRSERLHRLFRIESELNTPLFVGFPGLISKLWCAHDTRGAYRGLYEWDGAALADGYARALWRVLALVSVRGSIHYRVLPSLTRGELLSDPTWPDDTGADDGWWRLTGVETTAG